MASKRRGAILAGGTGSRLRPLTYAINKHLLPIFDRPMVTYPLETLKGIGIKEVCVVTGREDLPSFKRLLGHGRGFGAAISYRAQDGPRGVADALLKTEDFFKKEKAVAILGDHLYGKIEVPKRAFTDGFAYVFIQGFDMKEKEAGQGWGAVAEFDSKGKLVGIEEKPEVPKSNYIVTGFYIYPNDVFDHIREMKPSERDELEITDLNNWYIRQKRLKAIMIESFILDAGTFGTLLKATVLRAKELGYKISYDAKK